MKTAVVFLADGFEECEALLVVDLLRRAGVHVVMASVNGTKEVISSRKILVGADELVENVDYDEADMLILPGGVDGTAQLMQNTLVKELCLTFGREKQIAAICAAPSVLAACGLLEGKRATCHPSVEDRMQGALLTGESVTTDGNVTTGQGLGAGMAFAFELVKKLAGEAEAERIAAAICYKA